MSVPGQRQNDAARVPPSQGVPFCPRMPALKTSTPAVPPLSFMKMTSVFCVEAPLVELRQQPADVVVDVRDHAEELGRVGMSGTLSA